MQSRKFAPHQEMISASSLVGHILSIAKDKSFMACKDVDEKKMEALAYDAGYIAACNDIIFILMADPKTVDKPIDGEDEMPTGPEFEVPR